MDDAGGGRRGLRATPSRALFEALRDGYGIEGTQGWRDLGGSSSLNLLVWRDNARYVVRVYRPHMTAARLADIQLVRHHLAAAGVPCFLPVPTRDGRSWCVAGGRLAEVERFIAWDEAMDTWERLGSGLGLLGRIHTLLRGVEVSADGKTPMFANHIAPQDALGGTLRGAQRIRGWGPSPAEARLADDAEELARLVAAAEQDFTPALPRQLVHGDYWDNNVLFHEGRVALVADFDFMGERARIDDLALTLYFAVSTFADDPLSDDSLGRLRALVAAYDQGLADPLSGAERAALPLAIARQPLWSLGGWVVLLDDEGLARQHASGMFREVGWALRLMRELTRWQATFA